MVWPRWLLLAVVLLAAAPAGAARRPNVLFIAIDDLNDWVGPLGGHPQVKTPQMDRLAARGVVFTHAHTAAPLCNPSRAAVWSGMHPYQTGVFANDEKDIRKVKPNLVLLPAAFKQAGYRTFGTGKLLHHRSVGMFDEDFFPEQRWSPFRPDDVDYTPDELPSKASDRPRHLARLGDKSIVLPLNGMPSDRAPRTPEGESFDWGPLDVADDQLGDGQIARWAAERLAGAQSQPFFLAVGFYRPHIPLFAPKKYFDLYGAEEIKLPVVKPDDLVDLGPAGKRRAVEAVTAGAHATVVKHGQWAAAVKAYLASVSFVDAQIGRLLDALDRGPHARDTIVVMWSDHGWHLGEKQHWGKWTGWQRATRVPLVIVPAASSAAFKRGVRCAEPVSLVDLYPTLLELGGLPANRSLAGESLVALLRQPKPRMATGRRVLTTFDAGNHAVSGERWRYIRYADGSEELYDLETDPNEWHNLAASETHVALKRQMMRAMPPAPAR